MKIREYLAKKYNVAVPSTMTKLEARAFDIPFPLVAKWLEFYGDRPVTDTAVRKIEAGLGKRLKKQERKMNRGARHTRRGLAVVASIDKKATFATTDAFLLSYEWRRVRMQVLKKHGARCQCCGATANDGLRMHVDHIKPRKLFPELALSLDNLQVLCEECNHGKGNWDETDWRPRLVVNNQ